jgi:hypothetical protein
MDQGQLAPSKDHTSRLTTVSTLPKANNTLRRVFFDDPVSGSARCFLKLPLHRIIPTKRRCLAQEHLRKQLRSSLVALAVTRTNCPVDTLHPTYLGFSLHQDNIPTQTKPTEPCK